jgi:hypothetical protein
MTGLLEAVVQCATEYARSTTVVTVALLAMRPLQRMIRWLPDLPI